jgi:hypothetical protein
MVCRREKIFTRPGSKLFGVSLAWSLYRVISAFYTAIRGAQLFAHGLAQYAERSQQFQIPADADSSLFPALVCGIASLGFLSQMFYGFALPFPFNLLLFPLSLVESFLMWVVAVQ